MPLPTSKIRLRKPSNTRSYVATVLSYDESTNKAQIEYEKNEYMVKSMLESLPSGIQTINLSNYKHEWITPDSIYCHACHSEEYDDLYSCNSTEHGDTQVSFHSHCLEQCNKEKDKAYILPSAETALDWDCPFHYIEAPDSDYELEESIKSPSKPPVKPSRPIPPIITINPPKLSPQTPKLPAPELISSSPTKKRRLNNYQISQTQKFESQNLLNLDANRKKIYPTHSICSNCVSKKKVNCDGQRPCNECWQQINNYYLNNNLDLNNEDTDYKIHKEAQDICVDRFPTYHELEKDRVFNFWYANNYGKKFNQIYELNRNLTDSFILSNQGRPPPPPIDISQTKKRNKKNESNSIEDLIEKEKKKSNLTLVDFEYTQKGFVSSVPVYAKYQCEKCKCLLPDLYAFKMHNEWAHQKVITSEYGKEDKWNVVAQFRADNKLNYTCPYSGCLRGATATTEIEDHILRHHDVTDPTKPIEKKIPFGLHKRRQRPLSPTDIQKTFAYKSEETGILPLTENEKEQVENVLGDGENTENDGIITKFVNKVLDGKLDHV